MSDRLAFHPSVFIKDELEERKWSVHDLVFRMRRYDSEKDWGINCLAVEMYLEVHEPGVILSCAMAMQFGDAFGISAEMFLNLDAAWREAQKEPRP